jgi:hypothetical protein
LRSAKLGILTWQKLTNTTNWFLSLVVKHYPTRLWNSEHPLVGWPVNSPMVVRERLQQKTLVRLGHGLLEWEGLRNVGVAVTAPGTLQLPVHECVCTGPQSCTVAWILSFIFKNTSLLVSEYTL